MTNASSRRGRGTAECVIHLNDQRGVLWVDGKPAMNFPVCTGKSAHETPRGKFSIIQKDADYRSRSYGSVFDASGLCVKFGRYLFFPRAARR